MSGVRRKRSRVSGLGAIDFMSIIAVAGGAVAAGLVNKVVPATVNPNLVSGGKIALGVALPMFIKSPLMSGIGAGMIAVGSYELVKTTGIVSGFGVADSDMVTISLEGVDVLSGNDFSTGVLAGNDDISVVNGLDDISVVNGYEMYDNDNDYL
jgi:hypothetical protein